MPAEAGSELPTALLLAHTLPMPTRDEPEGGVSGGVPTLPMPMRGEPGGELETESADTTHAHAWRARGALETESADTAHACVRWGRRYNSVNFVGKG